MTSSDTDTGPHLHGSRKHHVRDLLATDMRHRELTKQAKADRALYWIVGGETAWQSELVRRRRQRNERTRARIAEIVQSKAAAPLTLWTLALLVMR